MDICMTRGHTFSPASASDDITEPKISKKVENPLAKTGASLWFENMRFPNINPIERTNNIIKVKLGMVLNKLNPSIARTPPKILAMIITSPTFGFANAGLIDKMAIKVKIRTLDESLKI